MSGTNLLNSWTKIQVFFSFNLFGGVNRYFDVLLNGYRKLISFISGMPFLPSDSN